MMSQILSRAFFVFTGFFCDAILKVGLMFPQDVKTLNLWFDAKPLAALTPIVIRPEEYRYIHKSHAVQHLHKKEVP